MKSFFLIIFIVFLFNYGHTQTQSTKDDNNNNLDIQKMDKKIVEKRKKEIENFITESFYINVDFAKRLGLQNPALILQDFETLKNFIFTTVNDFIKSQEINNEERNWIIVRISYVLGEYFHQKYQGYWDVNENIDSVQYGHYVVYVHSPTTKKTYPIDVFLAAKDFIDQKPDRNLIKLIEEIEAEIK